MKFKRLFVVLLISLRLLSVPCAYAVEDNMNSFTKASIMGLDVVRTIYSPTDFTVDVNQIEELKKEIELCENKLNEINVYLKNNIGVIEKNRLDNIFRERLDSKLMLDQAKMALKDNMVDEAKEYVFRAKFHIKQIEILSENAK